MPSYTKPLLYLRRILVGLRAFTVQFYTEANVKQGLQYEYSTDNSTLAAGGVQRLLFVTGSKPAIIKSRQLSFTLTKITTRVYKNPTYTGGAPATIYNLNDINPQPSTVTILTGANITDPGEEFGAPNYIYGAAGIGNSESGTFTAQGIERVLAPNTAYVLELENSGSGEHAISAYLTWYEGTPDLPADENLL